MKSFQGTNLISKICGSSSSSLPKHHHDEQQHHRKIFGAVPSSGIEQWLARLNKGSKIRKIGVMIGMIVVLVVVGTLMVSSLGRGKRVHYSSSFTLGRNAGKDKDIPPLQWIIPEKFIPTRRWKLFHRDFNNERIKQKKPSVHSHGDDAAANDDNRISMLAFREYGDEIRQLMEMGKDSLQQQQQQQPQQQQPTLAFRKRLKDRAPWLRGNPTDDSNWPFTTLLPSPRSSNGDDRAIMICAGEPQLSHLKTLVYSIRVIHSSLIPIRIVYRDDNDLTIGSRQQVIDSLLPDNDNNNAQQHHQHDIEFIDLSKIFDLDDANLKAGWNLKPFGLLAVPFKEVMTLDVDVVLLQSPDTIFEMKGYKETGALFFHDRMFLNLLGFYDPGVLAKALQPNLSDVAINVIQYGSGTGSDGDSTTKTTSTHRMTTTGYRSEFVMESGLVLIDKGRRALGVWAICLLMGREDIREYAQAYYVYGDKELYWIGFETVSQPYSFPKYYPGAYSSVATDFQGTDVAVSPNDDGTKISTLLQQASTKRYALCGRLLHFDDDGQPIWSNGGYYTKEEDWHSSSRLAEHPLNPLWYIDGGEWKKEDFIPNVPIGTMPLRGIWSRLFGPKVNPEIQAILDGAEKVWDSVTKQINDSAAGGGGGGKGDNAGGLNQYWRIHAGMGVMCLYSNARGIRTVPKEMAYAASEATKRYFVHERGMPEHELLWGK